jgi:hypothetical protein
MLRKVAVLALLIAVVMATFPTTGVFAKSPVYDQLENKWEELGKGYTTQMINHGKIHKMVDNYLATHKKATTAQKNELEKHLTICNSSLDQAKAIIEKRAGFDAKGKVTDLALAKKTVTQLAELLTRHAGSVKNIKEHTNQ